MKKPRIVILGGGFAGLLTAVNLVKLKTVAEIILIDKNSEHLYTPWLYKIPSDLEGGSAGSLRSCHFLFREILKPYKNKISFRQATAKTLMLEKKTVVLDNNYTIEYDYLVLSLGAKTNFFGLKDIENIAHKLNDPHSVEKVYKDFKKIMNEALAKKRDAHVVIVGGGATGIEITMELASIRKKMHNDHFSITLIDAADYPLKRFHKVCGRDALKRIKQLDVHYINKSVVTGIEGKNIQIKNEKRNSSVRADLVLWAGGVAPNDFIRKMSFRKDDDGRIIVDSFFRVENEKSIFAIGDNAAFLDESKGISVPPTAWAAVEQAPILARNIHASITGGVFKEYNPPKYYPGLIALGGHFASGSAFGIPVRGFLGWLLKEAIHLHYFMKIMTWNNALKTFKRKKLICR
jgi:NADH dehydrogenase